LQSRADSFRAFSHSLKAPVPLSTCIKFHRANPAAVIPYREAEPLEFVLDRHLNLFCTRVRVSIEDRFASYPVDVDLVPASTVDRCSFCVATLPL